jgi:hypothetical protein
LFPINKDYRTFQGSEYLKIYPYIDYEDGNGKYNLGGAIVKGYYVKTPIDANNVTLVSVSEWLRNGS